MDYAVIKIGGTQYKVQKGDTLKADILLGKHKKSLKIDNVLMCHIGRKVEIGSPYLKGASVSCDILNEGRSDKVVAYKYKKRKSSKFKKGHRQRSITFKVKGIKTG